MTNFEDCYIELINTILDNGELRKGRNGITKSIFGASLTIHNLRYGSFPLLIGRKMHYRGVLGEFAAFIRGPKTLQDFERQGCNYWAQWANPDGSIDIDYGNQWRDFNGVDQLKNLIEGLKNDPYGRRHIINAWRPDRLDKVNLPCCHFLYQFYVTNTNHLDLIFYMRSVDTMVGMPSDIILAALLVILVAKEANLRPGTIKMVFGDTHIYEEHFSKVNQYISQYQSITNKLDTVYEVLDEGSLLGEKKFTANDLIIKNYFPNNPISFEVKT